MPTRTVRRLTTVTLALAAALTWVPPAHAAGAVNIDSCQILDLPNTTYKLTTDLTSCGDCLMVAADRIIVDLQGHNIRRGPSSACIGSGIHDEGVPRELVVVKNGAVRGFVSSGVGLGASTRVSVLGVQAISNNTGIVTGSASLVKSSVAHANQDGIVVGERSQVQQSDASGNVQSGITAGGHCLVTMNIVNNNGGSFGILGGAGCTVSFNTANNNRGPGFRVGPRSLVTQNTAIGNGFLSHDDFDITCPSDVTFNTSTNGFPASYSLSGSPPCKTAHNE